MLDLKDGAHFGNSVVAPTFLGNLDASFITSGTLASERLPLIIGNASTVYQGNGSLLTGLSTSNASLLTEGTLSPTIFPSTLGNANTLYLGNAYNLTNINASQLQGQLETDIVLVSGGIFGGDGAATSTTPCFTFENDLQTGVYPAGPGVLGITSNGTPIATFSAANGLTVNANVSTSNYFIGNGRFLTGIEFPLTTNASVLTEGTLQANLLPLSIGTVDTVYKGNGYGLSSTNAGNLTGILEADVDFTVGSIPTTALYGELNGDLVITGDIDANVLVGNLDMQLTFPLQSVPGNAIYGTIPSSVLPLTIGGQTTNFTGNGFGLSINATNIYGNSFSIANITANTVATNEVTTIDGTSGLAFNSMTKRINVRFGSWLFDIEGGVSTPIGKTRVVYDYTGADQTFVVPAGVTFVYLKLWGGGGGAARAGGWTYGADGGGGGHTRGLVPVTPGESLLVKVGAGGRTAVFATAYGGGGGALNADVQYGGQGGGGSSLFRSTTPLLYAGGGGGGGSSNAGWFGNCGGAGGGTVGQKGEAPFAGQVVRGGTGGTQTVGGSATGGVSGTLYTGGTPGTGSYGGGGGGGYYGGGGGGFDSSVVMGGGGGGSGYVSSGVYFGGTFVGNFRVPAFSWDPDLSQAVSTNTSYAYGGQNTQNNQAANSASGGNGYIIIYY